MLVGYIVNIMWEDREKQILVASLDALGKCANMWKMNFKNTEQNSQEPTNLKVCQDHLLPGEGKGSYDPKKDV